MPLPFDMDLKMHLGKSAVSMGRSICLLTSLACGMAATTFGEDYRLDEDTGIGFSGGK